jgi:hypothetical protein
VLGGGKARENADKGMTDNAAKMRKGGAMEYKEEAKSLISLQVKCRSIYDKALDFANLVDTYIADIIIGTES